MSFHFIPQTENDEDHLQAVVGVVQVESVKWDQADRTSSPEETWTVARSRLIAERGATVTARGSEMLLDERIPSQAARQFLTMACELDVLVFIRVAGRTYVRPRRKHWWERGVAPDPGTEVVDDLVEHIGDGPTLFVANGRVAHLRSAMPHGAVRARLMLPRTEAESLIVTPGAGTYAHALRAVQRSLGVARSDTLAIVGSEDAHALFEQATLRVARNDADDRIIASASWHAPDSHDDVAAALERFVETVS